MRTHGQFQRRIDRGYPLPFVTLSPGRTGTKGLQLNCRFFAPRPPRASLRMTYAEMWLSVPAFSLRGDVPCLLLQFDNERLGFSRSDVFRAMGDAV